MSASSLIPLVADGACRRRIAADYPGHVSGLGNWWDSVELWVTGLPFVPQVAVVMVVLVPLAAGLARVLDMLFSWALALVGRGDPSGEDSGADDRHDRDATPEQKSMNVEVEK